MKYTFAIAVFAGMTLLASCGEEKKDTTVVESGTYTGKAEELDADEKEIYVRTSEDQLLELYFTKDTKLTKDGAEVDFNTLKEGGNLEVTVEKKGNRLEPVAVEILD